MQKSEHRLNYSRMPDSQFHDKVDFQLRVAASQLRTLKTNSTQLARCLRKASREEGQALEELLAMISLPDEKEETKTVEKEEEKKTPVTETAMVVYEPPQEDKSPLKIFSRILAQKNSGDSEQGEPTSANRSASSSTGTSRPHLVRQNDMLPFPTATASPKRILKRQNAFVSFSKAESCWLAEILSKSIEDCNVCTSNILWFGCVSIARLLKNSFDFKFVWPAIFFHRSHKARARLVSRKRSLEPGSIWACRNRYGVLSLMDFFHSDTLWPGRAKKPKGRKSQKQNLLPRRKKRRKKKRRVVKRRRKRISWHLVCIMFGMPGIELEPQQAQLHKRELLFVFWTGAKEKFLEGPHGFQCLPCSSKGGHEAREITTQSESHGQKCFPKGQGRHRSWCFERNLNGLPKEHYHLWAVADSTSNQPEQKRNMWWACGLCGFGWGRTWLKFHKELM